MIASQHATMTKCLFMIQMFFVVLLLNVFLLDARNCIITQHPKIIVALLNDRVTLSCYGILDKHHKAKLFLNHREVTINSNISAGVYWNVATLNMSVGFEVFINVTIDNNGTTVQCVFDCATNISQVIAVNCELVCIINDVWATCVLIWHKRCMHCISIIIHVIIHTASHHFHTCTRDLKRIL